MEPYFTIFAASKIANFVFRPFGTRIPRKPPPKPRKQAKKQPIFGKNAKVESGVFVAILISAVVTE